MRSNHPSQSNQSGLCNQPRQSGLLRVGLTGGIASGKSKISQLFANKEITIIDADKIARHLFEQGSALLKPLKTYFGEAIFDADGALKRKELGEIVFNDPQKLEWLNQLTHPEVAKTIEKQLASARSPYVIVDIPLLIKTDGTIPAHLKPLIDRVLVIEISEHNQIDRLCRRDKLSVAQAKAIMSNQSSLAQKLALADDVIDNNGHIDALESQVELLHNQYLILANQRKK